MKILNRWIFMLVLACITNLTNAQTNQSSDPEGSSDGYVNYDTESSEDIQSITKSRYLEYKSSTEQSGTKRPTSLKRQKCVYNNKGSSNSNSASDDIEQKLQELHDNTIQALKDAYPNVINDLNSKIGKVTTVDVGKDYGSSKYDKAIAQQSDIDFMEENRAAGFDGDVQLILVCCLFFAPIIGIGIWIFVKAHNAKKRSDSFLDEKTFRNDNSRS